MKRIRIFQDHTEAGVTTRADPVNGTEIELPDESAGYVLAAEGQRRAEVVARLAAIQEADA